VSKVEKSPYPRSSTESSCAKDASTFRNSDKPLNDARHAVVITLSDLVHALETDPTPIEKIERLKAQSEIWSGP
jgi:hypothetical protein